MQIGTRVTLHSADRYPSSNAETASMGLAGRRNEEMRAMTIAAFRVAQNNDQLSQKSMDVGTVDFLLANSTSAINHWIKKSRLSRMPAGYRLEAAGIVECQNTLLGLSGAYSTTETKVRQWVNRMINGDEVARRTRDFDAVLWSRQT
jgi:hypothetical protein